jgi:hypothetical protein
MVLMPPFPIASPPFGRRSSLFLMEHPPRGRVDLRANPGAIMQKAIEYCLKSQIVAEQAQREHDPAVRDALISDAQSWFVLAEIELWLEEHEQPSTQIH